MTDPVLRDPQANHDHYAHDTRYENNKTRLTEKRVLWAASKIRTAPQPRRILDLGCNDGFLTEFLSHDDDWVGLELNTRAIEHAYPRSLGQITRADIVRDPFPDGPWSAIVCMEVLEHLVDPHAFLVKVREACSPSTLVITTSALGPGEAIEPGNTEHLREWNPAEFWHLHNAAGFAVIDQSVAEVYPGRYTNCIVAKVK